MRNVKIFYSVFTNSKFQVHFSCLCFLDSWTTIYLRETSIFFQILKWNIKSCKRKSALFILFHFFFFFSLPLFLYLLCSHCRVLDDNLFSGVIPTIETPVLSVKNNYFTTIENTTFYGSRLLRWLAFIMKVN